MKKEVICLILVSFNEDYVHPVALDYWTAKHVLMQAAQTLSFKALSPIDPDNTASGSFGEWLRLSMKEIEKAGYQVTINKDQMKIYVVNLAST